MPQKATLILKRSVVGVRKIDIHHPGNGVPPRVLNHQPVTLLSRETLDRRQATRQVEMLQQGMLQEQMDRLRSSAYQEGFTAGQAKQQEESMVEIAQLRNLIEDLRQGIEKTVSHLEKPLLELSSVFAGHIVGTLMTEEIGNILIRANLQKIILTLVSQANLRVEVNPCHIGWLTEPEQTHNLVEGSGISLQFLGNSTLKAGECRVLSDDFHVDLTLENQLQQMLSQLIIEAENNKSAAGDSETPQSFAPEDANPEQQS